MYYYQAKICDTSKESAIKNEPGSNPVWEFIRWDAKENARTTVTAC
jgi:hypothetical protein